MNIILKSRLFVVLGASLSLAAPLSAQNAPVAHAKPVVIRASRVPGSAGELGDPRPVYYITHATATGSRIPLVYHRYQGVTTLLNSSFQVGSSYAGRDGDVGNSGALNLVVAMRSLDPSIGSVKGLH